jgi:hypothetical protein
MKSALVALLIVCCALTVAAQNERFEWFPLQIAFAPEVQLMVKEVPIVGLRLNLGSGESDHVRGLDLGAFAGSTDFLGMQINAANYVQEKALGMQVGVVNRAGDFSGLALGAVNYTDGLVRGMTVAAVNVSSDVMGMQIGVFNYCHRMAGMQLGLFNVITDKPMSIMPFMNIYW